MRAKSYGKTCTGNEPVGVLCSRRGGHQDSIHVHTLSRLLDGSGDRHEAHCLLRCERDVWLLFDDGATQQAVAAVLAGLLAGDRTPDIWGCCDDAL